MEVTVTVAGVEELAAYWRELPGQLRRAAGWGAYAAAATIEYAARDTVPHRFGYLMASGELKKEGTDFGKSTVQSYTVVYAESYAWEVHEATHWNFGQPGERRGWGKDRAHIEVPPSDRGWRGAKWLEKALEEVRPKYEDIVGQAISGILQKQASASAAAGIPQGTNAPVKAGPPRLVKKGTTSPGATKPVAIYHVQDPAEDSSSAAAMFRAATGVTVSGVKMGKVDGD